MSVALIAYCGRFGGAGDCEALWRQVLAGESLLVPATGNEPSGKGVPLVSVVDRAEWFDPEFYGFSVAEATGIDPQQRVFLDLCREALESAGYADIARPRRIGVFGSVSFSTYLASALRLGAETGRGGADYATLIGNDKDFFATRVAFKLNLTGPALTVQSACSSSLVAMHYAIRSINAGECEAALVGAASITFPQDKAHHSRRDDNFSPDWTCRPFDESANGLVKGNGACVVLLKPLTAAVRDGDRVLAIVKRSWIANDGARKLFFSAPSPSGQQDAISGCVAGEEAVDYIETHGTGTRLGDPIEIHALASAYEDRGKPVPVGSVKANIGHLDAAAGIAGVIKATMMLNEQVIPPIANLRTVSPEVSPYLDRFAFPLSRQPASLTRIGVSGFGIGGTNVHALLERYERRETRSAALSSYLIPISYRVESDLPVLRQRLAAAIHSAASLEDLVFSLGTRGNDFLGRAFVTGKSRDDLSEALEAHESWRFGAAPEKLLPGEAAAALVALGRFPNGMIPMDAADIQRAWREFVVETLSLPKGAAPVVWSEPAEEAPASESLRKLYELLAAEHLARRPVSWRALYRPLGWQQVPTFIYPKNPRPLFIKAPEPSSRPLPAANTAEAPARVTIVESVLNAAAGVLGVEKVASSDSLFDLGGDSLAAIELMATLGESGIECGLQDVLDHPVFGDLATFLERSIRPANAEPAERGSRLFLDPDAEIRSISEFTEVLEANTLRGGRAGVRGTETRYSNVLLTGSTGYLGAHLLHALLTCCAGRVTCLVRAENDSAGRERVRRAAQHYFGLSQAAELMGSIQVIAADLEDPIATGQHEGLADCDLVVHAAGLVKHYASANSLRRANVDAVRYILRFCAEIGVPLHHISTLAVGGSMASGSGGGEPTTRGRLAESDLFVGQAFSNLYQKAKYDAEKLVLSARAAGAGTSVFRLGNLSHRRSDGVFQRNFQDNAFATRIATMIAASAVPESFLDRRFDLTPVDAAADAICRLLSQPVETASVFHISAHAITGADLLRDLEGAGTEIAVLDGPAVAGALKVMGVADNPYVREILAT
ncbi:MAG: SDR family oxidoreductase, partial [Bifidobacteriaceae bacterium]|nr:SDR family oxidoreductase [Bifidobacteriaceae bacterium]